ERMRTEVHEQVTESARRGAQILLSGTIPGGQGTGYPATVVTGCTPSMPLFAEETFGPVAAIARSGSFEEALQAAAAGHHGPTPTRPPPACPWVRSRSTRSSAAPPAAPPSPAD